MRFFFSFSLADSRTRHFAFLFINNFFMNIYLNLTTTSSVVYKGNNITSIVLYKGNRNVNFNVKKKKKKKPIALDRVQ